MNAIPDWLAHHHRQAVFETLRNSADHTAIQEELNSHHPTQEDHRTGVQPIWGHTSASLHHSHSVHDAEQ